MAKTVLIVLGKVIMPKIDIAKAQRDTIKGKLQRLENYANTFNVGSNSINQIKASLAALADVRKEFEQDQYEIEQIEKLTDSTEYTIERSNFEDRYYDLISQLNDFIDQTSSAIKTVPVNDVSNTVESRVTLESSNYSPAE